MFSHIGKILFKGCGKKSINKQTLPLRNHIPKALLQFDLITVLTKRSSLNEVVFHSLFSERACASTTDMLKKPTFCFNTLKSAILKKKNFAQNETVQYAISNGNSSMKVKCFSTSQS